MPFLSIFQSHTDWRRMRKFSALRDDAPLRSFTIAPDTDLTYVCDWLKDFATLCVFTPPERPLPRSISTKSKVKIAAIADCRSQ
jgi:hypothetical protein